MDETTASGMPAPQPGPMGQPEPVKLTTVWLVSRPKEANWCEGNKVRVNQNGVIHIEKHMIGCTIVVRNLVQAVGVPRNEMFTVPWQRIECVREVPS